MTAIAKVYLTNRKCSFQEIVYHILSGLKLRKIFPGVYFVNTDLPEERVLIVLSGKELTRLRHDRPNIFEKCNVNCYMERFSVALCNGNLVF